MPSLIARSKFSVALVGVLLTFLGIVMLTNPGEATIFITSLVGWATAISGAGTLVAGLFGGSGGTGRNTGEIAAGILQLALGLLIVLSPGFFVSYLFLLLGIGVIVTGAGGLARGADARQAGLNSGLPMALGVLTILAGVAMVMAPFAAASAVSVVAAVSLIVSGVSELYVAFVM